MEKEIIIKGIRDPETARRILCAIEDDPGELRQISTRDDVDWLPDFDFATYEDGSGNLHSLAWYPAPTVPACIIATMAAACQHLYRACGDYPEGLRVSTVTITADALCDEPIAPIGIRCNGQPLPVDTGTHAVMQAGMAAKIIKGEM